MDEKQNDYVGARLAEFVRSRRWLKLAAMVLAALITVGLGLALVVQLRAEATPVVNPDANVDPVVTAMACDDTSVNAAVERALSVGAETAGNALLAFPSEVPAQAREAQTLAWESLSNEDRAFQLCLHLKQDGISG